VKALAVRLFQESDCETWDQLVAHSWNGTFLHTRRFLSYHRDRFADASLVIEDAAGTLLGVFPAAVDPDEPSRIVSHPGITYGGIVHAGDIRGELAVQILQQISSQYFERGFSSFQYKAVPHVYQRYPSEDDLYALFRLDARRYRSDLSSVIDLVRHGPMSQERERNLKRALKSDIEVAAGSEFVKPFWNVLTDVLYLRHGSKPVHRLEEILHLLTLFPNNIECTVGLLSGKVVAGIVTFATPRTLHMQYSASTGEGNAVSASTLVLKYVIDKARADGFQYFSFGISTESQGRALNEGLYRFKNGFGAGGIVHEFYELDNSRGGPWH
jgi:hypothetical protein